jgi:hypothetical protein
MIKETVQPPACRIVRIYHASKHLKPVVKSLPAIGDGYDTGEDSVEMRELKNLIRNLLRWGGANA